MTWDRTLTTNTHNIYLAWERQNYGAYKNSCQFVVTDGKYGYNFGNYDENGSGTIIIGNRGTAKLFRLEKELEVAKLRQSDAKLKINYKIFLDELVILLKICRERKECWQ